MSRVVLVGAQPRSILNFRGELIKSLVQAGHSVTAMATNATADEVASLRALGATYHPYPVQRNGLSPLRDLRTWWSLRAAFRALRPDVVLAYTIKPIIWGGLACRAVPSARFYALVTGLGFAFHGGSWRRRRLTQLVVALYRAGVARAAAVVFQNQDNAALFVELGIVGADRCEVTAGFGVDLDYFTRAPLPTTAPVFLMLSRLLGEKGIREYAEAARLVRERHPEVQCWLVGAEDPSPDRIPLSEVLEWQARGWIVYHGASTDVRSYLAACSVYVLPSYHEGMPRSVLEALAVGRPVITTDVPGCRDTVIQNENGFLVPRGDAPALAERMLWLVENPDAWSRMAERSRQLAEDRFDVRRVNQQLARIMELHSPTPAGSR